MVTTELDAYKHDSWYLDTGFSIHMTGHRDWMIDFEEYKSKVGFTYHRLY